MYPQCSNRALEIVNMSDSSPSCLKLFTAHKTNRQLSFVYPNLGFFLSMLGERLLFLGPFLVSGFENSIPVISHLLFQRIIAHWSSRSKDKLFFLALPAAPFKRRAHG